jgi:tetratricopeptide (TPR) repeat protein
LAAELRVIHSRSGVSLKQLERHVHVSDSSLSRYLAGQVVAPWPVVEALCRLGNGDARKLRKLWETARETIRKNRSAAVAAVDVIEPAAAAAVGAPHRRPPAGNRLPRDVQDFTGREAEVRFLLTRDDPAAVGVAVVLIDGMAGVGKTALAVHTAHLLAADHPDGLLYLDLHGHTPGTGRLGAAPALRILLGSLGVPSDRLPESVPELAALWRAELAGRRILTVLDNAADEDQVSPLLPGAAGCTVLVTSRRRLADLDGVRHISLDVLPDADAAALFAEGVGGPRPGTEPEAAAEVRHLCGHLPLALRLASARLRHRPAWRVADLAELLRDEQSRLAELGTRDRGVAAAFAVSEQHLTPTQLRTFRLCGLIPGEDFDPFLAAAVTDLPVPEVRRLLEGLVDVHLVQQPAIGRYRFHDLLRQHARDTAAASEPADGLRLAVGRMLDFYLSSATTADRWLTRLGEPVGDRPGAPPATRPEIASAEQAKTWMGAERVNLHVAVRYAADHGYPGHAVDLSRAMFGFLIGQGYTAQAQNLLQTAVDTARSTGDRPGQACLLLHLGVTLGVAERHGPATDVLHQSLELYRELDDRTGQAAALSELGETHRQLGAYDEAGDYQRRALALLDGLGDEFGESSCREGDLPQGRARLRAALAIDEGLGTRDTERIRARLEALGFGG